MSTRVSERWAIEAIDVRNSSEEELRPVASLVGALMRERVAEDPEVPLPLLLRSFRATPDAFERRDWVARADGPVIGRALTWRRLYGEAQHARNVEIEVSAPHRRRGLGLAFLFEVVDSTSGDPEAMLGFVSTDRIPAGERFLRRIGAEPGMDMTTNQLDLAAVDRELVASWARIDPPGYRLEWIDEDVPERLLDNVVEAFGAMSTTPTGSLRIWDFSVTRETVRSFERSRRDQGRHHHLVMAIDGATGRTAGFTEVSWHPEQPHALRQGGTAVVVDHQGRGVGKWLKGLLLQRILAEHPEARYVRTNNNPVNAPIIAINERLGYRPAWKNTVWQMRAADARRVAVRR